ncbi:MAG: hypothetical protein E4H24_00865, partial [Thermomicrobiales bacterium]
MHRDDLGAVHVDLAENLARGHLDRARGVVRLGSMPALARSRLRPTLVALLALAWLFAACGGSSGTDEPTAAAPRAT